MELQYSLMVYENDKFLELVSANTLDQGPTLQCIAASDHWHGWIAVETKSYTCNEIRLESWVEWEQKYKSSSKAVDKDARLTVENVFY